MEKKIRIVTHNGKFHVDDLMATAALQILHPLDRGVVDRNDDVLGAEPGPLGGASPTRTFGRALAPVALFADFENTLWRITVVVAPVGMPWGTADHTAWCLICRL